MNFPKEFVNFKINGYTKAGWSYKDWTNSKSEPCIHSGSDPVTKKFLPYPPDKEFQAADYKFLSRVKNSAEIKYSFRPGHVNFLKKI